MTASRLSAVLGVLALIGAGCAGGTAEERRTTGAQRSTAGARLTTALSRDAFPELRVVYDDGIDYLDPGLAYTKQSWALLWHVHLPLLTYRHAGGSAGAELVPALADQLPEISDDGLVYRLRLRAGIRYSDGRPVRASDVEFAIERLLRMDSPGARLFRRIDGADRLAATKEGGLDGIVADDESRTVEFRLVEPQADFEHVLATTFAAPVPSGTDDLDQSARRLPATGPYAIASYEPGRRLVLVRNTYFRPVAGVSTGNPDRITVEFVRSEAAALARVLRNQADFSWHGVPPGRFEAVRERYPDRLRLAVAPTTHYFFLNSQAAPFDRLELRRAVNYAIDRRELAALVDPLARPTQNVLPPGSPGYERVDPYPHDPERARRLVERAGARGTQVTVWASSSPESRRAGRYLVGVLREIGLRPAYRELAPLRYLAKVGNHRSRAQIGVASWSQDYPHPLNWLDPLLNGDRIAESLTTNLSNADVPELNERLVELARAPVLTEAIAAEWAAVERLALEHALVAPYANRRIAEVFSSRIDLDRCYVDHVVYRIDLARLCVN